MLHLGHLRDTPGRRSAGESQTVSDWVQRFVDLAATAQDPRLRAFYARGVPAADTLLEAVPMVALDVETTGLDPRATRLSALGWYP